MRCGIPYVCRYADKYHIILTYLMTRNALFMDFVTASLIPNDGWFSINRWKANRKSLVIVIKRNVPGIPAFLPHYANQVFRYYCLVVLPNCTVAARELHLHTNLLASVPFVGGSLAVSAK